VFRRVDRWGGVDAHRLHPDAVRRILRRRAAAAGIEGTALEPVTPHGLRAGFVTQAYIAGARDEAIMGHTRHRDLKTMRRYVRRARLLEDSPARKLGLWRDGEGRDALPAPGLAGRPTRRQLFEGLRQAGE
jgi:integrase